jgi:hypothetical protein
MEQTDPPAKVASNDQLGRKLLDVACRMRVGETLLRDDEMVDEAAHALKAARDDKERLDFLQWLMTRTEYQNKKVGARAVDSDMHIGGGWCGLYVRNMFGHPAAGGSASARDVREAIDAVAAVLRPNVELSGHQRPAQE